MSHSDPTLDLPVFIKVIGIIISALVLWNTYTTAVQDDVDAISLESAKGAIFVENIDRAVGSIKKDMSSLEKQTNQNMASIEGMEADISALNKAQERRDRQMYNIQAKIDAIYNYLLREKTFNTNN